MFAIQMLAIQIPNWIANIWIASCQAIKLVKTSLVVKSWIFKCHWNITPTFRCHSKWQPFRKLNIIKKPRCYDHSNGILKSIVFESPSILYSVSHRVVTMFNHSQICLNSGYSLYRIETLSLQFVFWGLRYLFGPIHV